ncbi:MAG TPA: SpoIIE family protein phosphatase [Acidimicrobiia bacterium]|nr:SpoIIE family protein phosphatase [Acidimicrobiia bacterium]
MTTAPMTFAEQRLALAVDAAQLGSWTWDMASGTTSWDERLEEMHGLAPGGFGGTFEDWVAALHPEDRQACITRVQEALADPGPYVLFHRTTWPDGSVHSIECRGTVLVDDAGQPTGTTGVAIDITMREQLVQTLQTALLPPTLPTVPGASLAARYRAADKTTAIGGDWYAAIALADDRLALAIGDVAGHGLDAVADMAAARFSLRTLALIDARPEIVLDRLNQVVRVFESDTMITALYGVLDPVERTWTFASAGHVPAVLRRSDGSACLLEAASDPPLGTASSFRTHRVDLGPDAVTLFLCTDGLVERRREPITRGLERLVAACATAPMEPELMCDDVIAQLLGEFPNQDDVAVVAVRLT